jgi:hypothetical protein
VFNDDRFGFLGVGADADEVVPDLPTGVASVAGSSPGRACRLRGSGRRAWWVRARVSAAEVPNVDVRTPE